MRRLILAITLALAAPAAAQDVTLPTLTFPQPGTFCGPLHLCEPLATRNAGG